MLAYSTRRRRRRRRRAEAHARGLPRSGAGARKRASQRDRRARLRPARGARLAHRHRPSSTTSKGSTPRRGQAPHRSARRGRRGEEPEAVRRPADRAGDRAAHLLRRRGPGARQRRPLDHLRRDRRLPGPAPGRPRSRPPATRPATPPPRPPGSPPRPRRRTTAVSERRARAAAGRGLALGADPLGRGPGRQHGRLRPRRDGDEDLRRGGGDRRDPPLRAARRDRRDGPDDVHRARPRRRAAHLPRRRVNAAWRTSMEVGVRVEAEDPAHRRAAPHLDRLRDHGRARRRGPARPRSRA